MQYALLSDIHGNLEALQAVLAEIERLYPQSRLLCPGDVVGYGPDPAACLEILQARQVPMVRGNHEEMVTGERDFSRCVVAGITAARWTRRELSAEQLEQLKALPLSLRVSPEVMMCHGDLLSADTYISSTEAGLTALEQLAALAPQAQYLLCGHTHHAAWVSAHDGFVPVADTRSVSLQAGRRYVLNPGAVGQSRDGQAVARFGVLDLEKQQWHQHCIRYPHELTQEKMRSAGLLGGVVLQRPQGAWRRVEHYRTRWARYWGERENRRLGLGPHSD
jgi:predicted phosphodiesterase